MEATQVGIYHTAGGEKVNRYEFASKIGVAITLLSVFKEFLTEV